MRAAHQRGCVCGVRFACNLLKRVRVWSEVCVQLAEECVNELVCTLSIACNLR